MFSDLQQMRLQRELGFLEHAKQSALKQVQQEKYQVKHSLQQLKHRAASADRLRSALKTTRRPTTSYFYQSQSTNHNQRQQRPLSEFLRPDIRPRASRLVHSAPPRAFSAADVALMKQKSTNNKVQLSAKDDPRFLALFQVLRVKDTDLQSEELQEQL